MNASDAARNGWLGVLQQWTHRLHDPLLSDRQVARLDTDLARAQRKEPDQVHTFFAGVISDAILTLPTKDPWRNLSAKYEDQCVGSSPPKLNGAVRPDGARFGTWRDGTDLIPLAMASAWDDPGLVALVEDLSPAAAAILASGGYGWRVCQSMIKTVWAAGVPQNSPSDSVHHLFGTDTFTAAANLSFARDACVDAVRWAIHRRRAYLGPSDEWVEEGTFRWAWRSTRVGPGQGWSDDDVERGIDAFAIQQLAPQDRPTVDDPNDF